VQRCAVEYRLPKMSAPVQNAPSTRGGRGWELVLILAIAISVPLGLRPISYRLTAGAPPSYIPSLEAARTRRPFDPGAREQLRRIAPRYVFIGDSTLGSRIDPAYMTRVLRLPAWWVMQPGTGSAYWFLALKNAVLDSGVEPKVVFIFFRDFTLTDVLFRLDDQFRWTVDTLARPVEPELDRAIARRLDGSWHAVPRMLDAAYAFRPVRAAADTLARQLPVQTVAGPARAGELQQHLNASFGLDRLRPNIAADIASGEDELGDFAHMLPRSVLPEMIALGRAHGVRLCFVRVQRRPRPDGPPVQSPVLQRYIGDLRRYLESNGAVFRDDTGDPDYPLAWYTDGDHTAFRYRQRYTELFSQKLAFLFR
jgi:hypothetical protein